MERAVRQRVLKHLAAISIAVASGLVDPTTSLLGIPSDLVEDIVDEVDAGIGGGWHADDRKHLLGLLAADPRVAVRTRVAEASASLWSDSPHDAQRIVRELANDSSIQVRAAAAKGLSAMLRRAAPIDRIELVCQWTVSPSAAERLAIAIALRSSATAFVTDLAIEQLATDENPQVRRAALRAAARHFEENEAVYGALAQRLLDDPNGAVRRTARRLIKRSDIV